MKEKILISACLLGVDCRYDGANNRLPDEVLSLLKKEYELVPVCPECYGGLTTPRTPSERLGDAVVSRDGADVTAQFERGARAALVLARLLDIKRTVLKENSPSCGCGTIYDGSFTGTLVSGDGVTAELLKKNGIEVIGESAFSLSKKSF